MTTEKINEVPASTLVRKPRHKWFAHTCREAESGWTGPHDHIEDALRAALLSWEADGDTAWVTQGRKLTKLEADEIGAEYSWEVDTRNAMKFMLPNAQVERRAPGSAEGKEQ